MLTDQRRRYAEARAKGYTKREAAIAAGCPPKTATQASARLERNVEVQLAIAAINGGQPLPDPVPSPAKPTMIPRPPPGVDNSLTQEVEDPLPETQDPVEFLRNVMNCSKAPISERNKAAIKLADLELKKKPAEEKPKTNKFRNPRAGNVVPLKAGNS